MRPRGFTLVELMISLAIAGFLLLLAMPMAGTWISDSQVRAGAESIASGLQRALMEATRRNASAEFVIDTAGPKPGWVVQPVGGGSTYAAAGFADGSDQATFTVSPAGNSTITFNALGQVAAANADGSPPFTQVDVTTSYAGTRSLRVLVGGGRTGVKICDPAYPATDPKGCPA
jgi:type IV fimbrial biogenesis protein FimT